jgi:hypothetical protein
MATRTPFNARTFFLTHGSTGTTTLKLLAGDESYRVRLAGIPTLTVEGIATHAASVPDVLRVSADKVELANGTIVATPTKGMLGQDVAAFVRGVASMAESTPVRTATPEAKASKTPKAV